jgi:hypothetical protein
VTPSPREAQGTTRDALRFVGAPWEERSLVRAKRYLLDQDCAVLLRYPPLRDHLCVALNGARFQPSPGRFCLVRPGFWAPKDGAMQFTAASMVQVDLGGPLIEWLLGELAERRPTWAELCARAERTFASGQGERRIRSTLEKLLEIGFLRLVPPWPTNEGDLAARMLDELRALPEDPLLAAFCADLERLLSAERGYASSPRPLEALQEMERLVGTLWESTRRMLAEPAVTRYKLEAGAYYEEVFLSGADEEAPFRPIVEVDPKAVGDVVRSGASLARLSQLLAPEHDFLHALAGFAEREWPGRDEVEFLELARKIQPLWQAYGRFLAEARGLSGERRRAACFDPFGLDVMRSLSRLREEVFADLERRMQHGGEEISLSIEDLEAALAVVPSHYAPSHDACLLLQPADPSGRRWVLNQLFEGTGRHGSRYTPVMPAPVRRQYTSHLAARARIADPSGDRELLDIVCSYGETLNVHATQTRAVLELNDESVEAPFARKLSLGDLRVRFDDPSSPPRIVDREGRGLAPVHLGVADRSLMPFVVRLLGQFGPQELQTPSLPRPIVERGAVRERPRVAVGPLVVRRRAFTFPASALPAELRGMSKREAFIALNHWRLDQGIPERVFVTERVRGALTKPQYVDFTSPHFASIFITSVMDEAGAGVVLEEMLPTPDAAPIDRAGRRWVVELQLDTSALRAPSAP